MQTSLKNSSFFLVNAFILLAGILLVLLYDEARLMEYIVIVLGIMFLVPSAISVVLLLSQMSKHKADDDTETTSQVAVSGGLLPVLGGICFGVSLILRPTLFIEIMSYIFALILIVGGLYHIFVLLITSRKSSVSIWLYFLPLIVTIAGFVLLLTDIRTVEKWVNLTTGISLICIAIASFSEYLSARKALKKESQQALQQ